MVNGNKTYAIALATAIYAILGVVSGLHDEQRLIDLLVVAGGMVGFRSALNKVNRKK